MKASAIYALAEIFAEDYLDEVLEIVIKAAQDNNLTVMVKSSQACSFLAQKSTDPRLVQLIINYCKSGKEKTTANGVRALGQLQIDVDTKIEQILVAGLWNKSAKVVWNSCVAIGKFVQRSTKPNLLLSSQTTGVLFTIMTTHQNLKSRIQAAQALLCYQTLEKLGGPDITWRAWQAVCDSFYEQPVGQSLQEQRYLEQLEGLCLQLWVQLSEQTVETEEFKNFFRESSAFVLTVIEEYLRRELKVPKYSEMFEN